MCSNQVLRPKVCRRNRSFRRHQVGSMCSNQVLRPKVFRCNRSFRRHQVGSRCSNQVGATGPSAGIRLAAGAAIRCPGRRSFRRHQVGSTCSNQVGTTGPSAGIRLAAGAAIRCPGQRSASGATGPSQASGWQQVQQSGRRSNQVPRPKVRFRRNKLFRTQASGWQQGLQPQYHLWSQALGSQQYPQSGAQAEGPLQQQPSCVQTSGAKVTDLPQHQVPPASMIGEDGTQVQGVNVPNDVIAKAKGFGYSPYAGPSTAQNVPGEQAAKASAPNLIGVSYGLGPPFSSTNPVGLPVQPGTANLPGSASAGGFSSGVAASMPPGAAPNAAPSPIAGSPANLNC